MFKRLADTGARVAITVDGKQVAARAGDTVAAALIAAGVLVGVGTRYGAGCTSGHGVCGLSRLSPRSLVATLAFMGAGFVTVFVLRHLVGF